jgi:hypothetical protein
MACLQVEASILDFRQVSHHMNYGVAFGVPHDLQSLEQLVVREMLQIPRFPGFHAIISITGILVFRICDEPGLLPIKCAKKQSGRKEAAELSLGAANAARIGRRRSRARCHPDPVKTNRCRNDD